MKIAQVCAVDTTIKNLLLPLIQELTANGYEVHAVCSPGSETGQLKFAGYIIQEIDIDRKIGLSNIATIYNLYKYFKKQRFDIVHVHTPVAAVLGRIAARLAGVPLIVYTAHGFYFHENMPPGKLKLFVSIEKAMATYTDIIFTQSREDYDFAVKTGIVGKKGIWHISNGIDLDKFAPENTPDDKNIIKESLFINPSDSIITFIGRMVKEKGIIDLIEAFLIINSQMPNTKLLLVGDTLESERDQAVKRKLVQLIFTHNLEDKVVFCGFREDIPELLSITDVFVLPSYREGMPRSIIEAMAMGKPVVATDIRGPREEVIDGETGYLIPTANPQALAQAILDILRDKSRARKMGREARARAITHFDEKVVIRKQLSIIETVTGNHVV